MILTSDIQGSDPGEGDDSWYYEPVEQQKKQLRISNLFRYLESIQAPKTRAAQFTKPTGSTG